MKKTVIRILLLLLCIGLFYVPALAAELPSEITAAETPDDLEANDPSLTEATVAEAPAYTADSGIPEDTEGAAADSSLSPSDEFVGAVTRTGWVKEGGKTYYYDAAGNKVTGWYQIGDVKPYFYPEDGHMAIGFNMDPVVYKRGSAIFLHCKSPDHWYTAGCVSVPEDVMLNLLKKTKNGAYIVTVPTRSMLKNY